MDIEITAQKMSLQEKIDICDGKNFWQTKDKPEYGIPALFMCDGPHGLRKQDLSGDTDMLGVNESLPATCFPAAVTSGASWDTDLIERMGAAIGEEANSYDVGLVLGPGANIKRNPLCGRNFEYFSEDPCVTGKMAAGFIRGLQRNGTGASLKHFACNNQEKNRFVSDSVIDERTLREIYLAGFEAAVKEASPATVMCSYNKINGVHSSDNRKLLTEILREEWGFDGLVVTDWGAMCDRVEGFRAGCDLNMPGGSAYMEEDVIAAVKTGKLSEGSVDDSARRVLRLMKKAAKALKKKQEYSKDDHHALAREVAESGAVLLKNDGVLPLRESQKVVIIGAMAKNPRYQGAGSSHITPFQLVSPVEALPEYSYVSGCDEQGNTTEALLREAAEAAKCADVAVVFAGLPDCYESEGFDRDNMKMPEGHIRMIEATAKVNPNTVVVLLCGSPVECPWADSVKGILYMGLGGQAVGEAIRNLLLGKISPSGKLTESWPIRYEDCISSTYYGTRDAQYREGVYVGYRYYEKAGIPVRWPFGYGLSYTAFTYSNLHADGESVRVTVTNTGKLAGAEVVQLYIHAPIDSGYRPVRELKGFQKVFLQPGESKNLEFRLDERTFAIWQEGWRVLNGIYKVQIADLDTEISISGESIELKGSGWYRTLTGVPSQAEWERYLGRKYVETITSKGSYTMENTVVEMKKHSLIMQIMYLSTTRILGKPYPKNQRNFKNPAYRMSFESSLGGPMRSMQISGGIRGGLFRGMVEMANGHYLRGIREMLKKG